MLPVEAEPVVVVDIMVEVDLTGEVELEVDLDILEELQMDQQLLEMLLCHQPQAEQKQVIVVTAMQELP